MKYYESTITGKIVTENALHTLNDIYGSDVIKDPIYYGILRCVDEPTVIDCIKHGSGSAIAIIRYREIHNCTLREASDMVEKMKQDIEKHSSNNKHN